MKRKAERNERGTEIFATLKIIEKLGEPRNRGGEEGEVSRGKKRTRGGLLRVEVHLGGGAKNRSQRKRGEIVGVFPDDPSRTNRLW